jgi:hypothetical protein
MLFGTADLQVLGEKSPDVEIQPGLEIDLGEVDWLQFSYELPGDRQDLFPSSLHPTMPPIVTLQLWRCNGGELGKFGMAQLRLSCRAGMRIRAFLVESVIDGAAASKALSLRFGYRPTQGEVTVNRRVDRIEGQVISHGRTVFHAAMIKPETLATDALQHIDNMNLAKVAGELRLLQIEPEITTLGLQRGEPRLTDFDADFWGLQGRRLRHPIIAAAAHTRISMAPVRYTQDPEHESRKPAPARTSYERATTSDKEESTP